MSVVTVTATVEADSVPPRVRLDVTDIGSPNLLQVTVTRLDPDGRTTPVRTNDGEPLTLTTAGANRVGLLYDYEAPYGSAVSYSTVESPTTTSAEVTVAEGRVWIIHPGVPPLSMPVSVATMGNRLRAVNRGVFKPLGRKSAIVVTDGARKAPEGTIELNTFTPAEAAAFEALTDDAAVLLLNIPATLNWGVAPSYVSLGDLEEGRLVDYAGEPQRLHTLPYMVVDRPAGGTTAARSYVDLLTFASYADLLVAYPTYLDLLAGP
jgi:hypothetical protein